MDLLTEFHCICICIDPPPQPSNSALKRDYYRLPLVDDVLPQLCKAKVFIKLDVKHAYWHVKLLCLHHLTDTPGNVYLWLESWRRVVSKTLDGRLV